jgi:hypothetical protein
MVLPANARAFSELFVLIYGIKLLCEVTSRYVDERGGKREVVER